jgi:hypothetical protein
VVGLDAGLENCYTCPDPSPCLAVYLYPTVLFCVFYHSCYRISRVLPLFHSHIIVYLLFFVFVAFCEVTSFATSSIFMVMAVSPVNKHSASFDTVRYAFAVFTFIILWTHKLSLAAF